MPWQIIKAPPLNYNRCVETKKYGSNERTVQNSRKRTKRGGDRQPIRCGVQNTGNQDAHKIIEYGHKMKAEMKAT